ncbi:carboxylesterase/lipase family protein [Eubacterium ruminantium]|uniref:carboxylesterase/lipase family protein n=1 Tax=Eubacterium ruminantium TaxID=42322 RepID=UPI001568695E|nr:carboxylesterase family protein [Eubacterium ruminantium]
MLREVKVENGKLKGLPSADPRVTVFKGVPYAAPPVGKNRWRAPQPCEDWDDVYLAYEFAPISVQDQPGVGDDVYCKEWHVDPDIPMDEDCLYLNVWTPAKRTDEKLPVLVWFFGGAFQWGYTPEMEFDGERLARRGIIVVSVNYRLALMGFMAHPEITKENPDAPANFGLLDQQAGLKWVYRNIAAFGGDPEKITIAGQSAGGASTMQQLTCPENKDIVKGAAIFSGMIRIDDEEGDIFNPIDLAEAERRGEAFFKYIGVNSLEEARKIDAMKLRDLYGEYSKDGMKLKMFPIDDGIHFKKDPLTNVIEGSYPNVPIITGYTSDEFTFGGVNAVEKTVKESCKQLIENDKKNGVDRKVYTYCFDPSIPGEDDPGTFHSVDLWFWFESISKCWRPFKGPHFDLARHMCNYLADFVKTGDPNGVDADGVKMPEWENYDPDKQNIFVFKDNK